VILVDTSVWIDHFHKPVARLVEALEQQLVLAHPFVIGELACGQLTSRRVVISLLSALPRAVVATDGEAMHLIEAHRLWGRRLAYVDVHLLAATRLTEDAQLWTADRRLQSVARALGLALA
jgi:predicted nucleic acid-binding protein